MSNSKGSKPNLPSVQVKQQVRQQLRQEIKQRRNALTKHEQQQASAQLSQQLEQQSRVQQARHIAIYLTNNGELATESFIHWCWQQGKQVYLPVIHPFCPGHLLFLHYQRNTTMITNHYGIAEPKLAINQVFLLSQLDIIFTPLVAFDAQGNRLGMGGGFYDRTLAQLAKMQSITSQINPPKVIGLAHDCQQVDSIPVENWDMPLAEIMTPNQHFIFPNNN